MIEPTTAITVADKSVRNSDLDTILVKVASRCNINCKYCYVYNMGDNNWSNLAKLISKDTILALSESLEVLSKFQEKPFSIVLHGGEPLLLGAKMLEFLLASLRSKLSIEYPISLQTNGVLITNELLDICSKYQTTIAISIDGPESIHNKFRVSHKDEGTFNEVMRGINTLKQHSDADFLYKGLLAVIDPTSNPKEVYSFFKEIEAPSVDFLYRDGNHTNLPYHKSSFNSTEYGTWMTTLLDIYLNDPNPLPIRILDDMLKVLLGGSFLKEGFGISDFGIIIVDTDGTIMKNDTLKSSYNGADKFKKPYNIKDKNLKEFLDSDEFQEYREMQKPSSSKCLSCPELNICGGGMILHRWKSENGFDNPSVYCSDQLHLIKIMRETLAAYNLVHA